MISKFFYYKTKLAHQMHKIWDRIFGVQKKVKQKKRGVMQTSFEWRGLMIDTARHMPSIEWLYKKVDELSELGMNKLHLHISDDQGWRIEIKKYPKLQEVASWRSETVVDKNFPTLWSPFTRYIGDGKRYGGYYTQEELKSLVAYAKSKKVDIVPEIDLPGHLTALLSAYPQYAAGPAPTAPATYWGIFDNVLAYTPEALQFIKNILDEVMDIFDSQYVHLGGDEVSLTYYSGGKETPHKILRELILYVQSRDKTTIVWDEALEVAVETGSVVMAWHSLEVGYEALQKGCKVIFCPTSHCYFDFYQGDPETEPLAIGGYLPVSTVEKFCITPHILEKYKSQVLGIQANLWTEYMSTEAQMDYMLYPRLEAFAKVAKGVD
jgi:hexosaminidase